MNQSKASGAVPAHFGKPVRRAPRYRGVVTQSCYIPMRDGVKIAVDVMLPKGLPAGARVPSILIIARYWRSFEMRMPWPPDRAPMGPRDPLPDFLCGAGYATVAVDVRGSGASYGSSPYPWNEEEVRDYGEVVDWITRQPWSDGAVGAIGISYEGASAELLAAAHPAATRVVVPQETEHDLYEGIVFPGGILNDYFMRTWQDTNESLDRSVVPPEWGPARFFLRGVRPVDGDRDRAQLREAVAEHGRNADVYASIMHNVYRDDPYGAPGVTLDDFSPGRYRAAIERSGAAIFGWGSWLDGTTADCVIRRFVSFTNPQRAVIGAWNHLYRHHASPYAAPKARLVPRLKEQWQEALEYFDHYLQGGPGDAHAEKQLFYYTMGAEAWKVTSVWPPAGTTMQRWYLADGHMLAQESPAGDGDADEYAVDFEATTGTTNRWHTSDGMTAVVYKDRARADRRLLAYTGPALGEDMEITGYPVVTLYVTSTAADGAFYVYLEDVDEKGKVIYVTEGQLRAIHRRVSPGPSPEARFAPYHSFKREDGMPMVPGEVAELSFGLQPTSALVRRGHRLRVAIAGHDKDTFVRIPAEGTPRIAVQRSRVYASHIDLPVVR